MIITRKWLNKYINFNNVSNNDIICALNNLGFEVEYVHNFDCNNNNNNIVYGQIKKINKIPDTNLKFCIVDIYINKNQKKIHTIICEENNVLENGYVIIALPGAVLANGIKVTKYKIKNFTSEGIICSLNKLGISKKYLTLNEQNEIILTFNEKDFFYNIKNNKNILSKIGLTDYLFDINLTLNRNDCLSSYEIARELANYFKCKLLPLKLESIENFKKYKNPLNVIIETLSVKCAININIKLTYKKNILKLSDRIWLKINQYKSNINDPLSDLAIQTTIETGQPLLLYDFNKIKNNLKITDNYENKFFNIKKGDLVIKDGDEFVELIGIKVNKNYVVSDTTTEITVLSLHLNNILMKKQQQKNNINNINLQRYIKSLSYVTVELGILRFLYLLKSNGLLLELSFINLIKKYKKNINPISINLLYINKFIGYNFNLLEIKKLLEPLSFKFKEKKDKLFIIPPLTRTDIYYQVDLIKEIIRLFGYNNIVAKPPILQNFIKNIYPYEKTIKNFENFFLNNGFYQAKTFTLVKQQEIKNFNFFNYKNPYKLLSPLSKEHEMMRLSLTNSLLKSVIYNNVRNYKNVKLFTIEKIYTNNKSYYHGSFICQEEIIKNKTTGEKLINSYYYIKSLLEAYLQNEQIDTNKLVYKIAPKNNVYHPYQTSNIFLEKKMLAIIGVINPIYQKKNNLKNKTYFGEINFEIICNYIHKLPIFFTPSFKFSSSNRDISIWLPSTLKFEEIKKKILIDVENVISLEVIDQYFDYKKMPKYSSLTISFIFNNIERQLKKEEIDKQFEKIKINIKKLKLQIR